ncbi:hemolysin A [Beutenbergia cavernae DSM 12333]|uniref:Hemolysin A n=1 Tax=Beutenbergia cavernae (strain ATCC BAA-8 / DSM 12333 / CCUG 43141 / JCM 11478 / NBRC 16432 / NCIMB 13614 / HKI 0122) TaxID=471853 RepID=C5BW06_BEUC1|nr:TlyA family RNA methyltransferase [Beutenbergia cavernae]ACQ80607.1 hemolysin A [Beutenbergia cavernae DSM 12333]
MGARLDVELVRRGLVRSRTHAQSLVSSRRVLVDGRAATRAATPVDAASALQVTGGETPDYVSRAGHKLAGALDALGPAAPLVAGRRALDAGASTGGFTDVLLRRGAAHVVAVDVGTDQLVPELRADPRVTVLERTNVRDLRPDDVAPAPQLVVGDLSFISLTLLLEPLAACAAPDAELLLLVKPQFEVGREALGAGGLVRSRELRRAAVGAVADRAGELGLDLLAVTPSPLPGSNGNIEYFVLLRAGGPRPDAPGRQQRHEMIAAASASEPDVRTT